MMRKLGIKNDTSTNIQNNSAKENVVKRPIEINNTFKRLSFLKNKNNEVNENENGKPIKIKEINNVFKICLNAVTNNRVGTRNAFDLHIIEHLEDLINLNDDEVENELNEEFIENGDFNLSFCRASKALEGASRIYGFRVEAIYDQTYNFLSHMNTDDHKSDMNEKNDDTNDKNKTNENSTKKIKKRKFECLQGLSTLSKAEDINLESLTLSNVSVDTFFLKLNSAYDHSCAQTYLLPNLNLNDDMSLEFDGDVEICHNKKRKTQKKNKDNEKNDNMINREKQLSINYEKENEDNENIKKEDDNDEEIIDYYDENTHNLINQEYKKPLYLNIDKIKDILYKEGETDFFNMQICPELEYFKEQIKKMKEKKNMNKEAEGIEDEIDEVDGMIEDEIENRMDETIEDKIKDKINENKIHKQNYQECNNQEYLHEQNGIKENLQLDNIKKELNDNIYQNENFENIENGMMKLNDSFNFSMNNDINENNELNISNNIFDNDNNLNNMSLSHNSNKMMIDGELKIEDLNIENVMQESLNYDMNLNNSIPQQLNFTQQDLSSLNYSVNINGTNLPEMIKTENKNMNLMMNTLTNFGFHSQKSLFKLNKNMYQPKKTNILSSIPEDDELWNRSIITVEHRLNAINPHIEDNYQYYITDKLLDGNFKNLMDMSKSSLKNKNLLSGNIIQQRKIRASFDINKINFYNLHVELNNVDLSTYDLWKKEKKKYICSTLFSFDQTSYVFETKENCMNSVNIVVDKVMKLSRLNDSNENNTNEEVNILLDDINNDFVPSEMENINLYQSKYSENYLYDDQMEDLTDNVQPEQALFESAVDKFCFVEADNVWVADKDKMNKDNLINENILNKVEPDIGDLEIKPIKNSFKENFEKVTNFVDVSKIKKILCDIVTKPHQNDEEKEQIHSIEDKKTVEKQNSIDDNKKIIPYENDITFKKIIDQTKSKLTNSESNALSIHMLFVCLLYTCNDEGLLLETIPNQNDFYVRIDETVQHDTVHENMQNDKEKNDNLMIEN